MCIAYKKEYITILRNGYNICFKTEDGMLTKIEFYYVSTGKRVKGDPVDFFLLLAQQPPVGQGLLIHEVSRSRRTTVGRTSLDE